MCFRDAIQQVFELRNKQNLCITPGNNMESNHVNGKTNVLIENPPSPSLTSVQN